MLFQKKRDLTEVGLAALVARMCEIVVEGFQHLRDSYCELTNWFNLSYALCAKLEEAIKHAVNYTKLFGV